MSLEAGSIREPGPIQEARPVAAGGTLRVLTADDLPLLAALIDRAPEAYCVVAERIEVGNLDPAASGGQTWGWYVDGELASAIYVGSNLIPVETTASARAAFASRLSRVGRRSSAIVGFNDEVKDLWSRLEPNWGPCREVRADQPLMVVDGLPRVSPDPFVTAVEPTDLDALLPASIAMFEEEVGVSPVSGGRMASYRARLADTIRRGRAYARFHHGEVLFKAEVGSVSRSSCQIQGVWVAPRLRGTGMSAPGIAAVTEAARRDHAPRISLYANRHNEAALAAYRTVGFRQIGTFATVLF